MAFEVDEGCFEGATGVRAGAEALDQGTEYGDARLQPDLELKTGAGALRQ